MQSPLPPVRGSGTKVQVGTFDVELAEEFFRALAMNGGITMHVQLFYGSNLHHILEAVFKAVGRALGKAVGINPRIRGVLSTKGVAVALQRGEAHDL